MVNTNASSVFSAHYPAMQVEINSLKATAATRVVAVVAVVVVLKLVDTCKKDNQNDNNITATAASPYKQRSVCRYTQAFKCKL